MKVPPHSVEAEQSVLGGLMLDNRAWDQVVDRLRESDFYKYEHRLIFKAVGHLVEQSKPVDVLTISETLRERRELDQAGGEVYLFELTNNTPKASAFDNAWATRIMPWPYALALTIAITFEFGANVRTHSKLCCNAARLIINRVGRLIFCNRHE